MCVRSPAVRERGTKFSSMHALTVLLSQSFMPHSPSAISRHLRVGFFMQLANRAPSTQSKYLAPSTLGSPRSIHPRANSSSSSGAAVSSKKLLEDRSFWGHRQRLAGPELLLFPVDQQHHADKHKKCSSCCRERASLARSHPASTGCCPASVFFFLDRSPI